jgi:1,2-phenylacetyl-CoA epoxidase catalytic subunit
VRREERYHLKHGESWWRTLADGPPEAKQRLERAVSELWPGMLGLFEEVEGESLLKAEGIVKERHPDLLEPWLARLTPLFERHGLKVPVLKDAVTGGRKGQHGPDWDELYDNMTMVRRLEPEGTW